ncbi:hypothetical protein Q8F55_002999 [Vanrija albida]|uniref:F-box domain-containing protein n=1 Tax=Vanrija albida TaxID=181172 RepID=A0ABR3QB91_9TREE
MLNILRKMTCTHHDDIAGPSTAPDTSTTQPAVFISAEYYPTIMKSILDECDRPTLIQLRLLNRKMKSVSEAYLFRHVMITDVTKDQKKGLESHTKVFEILDGEERRLPVLANCRVQIGSSSVISIGDTFAKQAAIADALAHVRILDVNTSTYQVDKLAKYFTNLDIVRIHHANTCHNLNAYPTTHFYAPTAIIYGSLLAPVPFVPVLSGENTCPTKPGKVILTPLPDRFACEGHDIDTFTPFEWSDKAHLVVNLTALAPHYSIIMSPPVTCGSTFKCFLDTLRVSLRSAINSKCPPLSITVVGLQNLLFMRYRICRLAGSLIPQNLELRQLLKSALYWPPFSTDELDNAYHHEMFGELEHFINDGKIKEMSQQEYEKTLTPDELPLEMFYNLELMKDVCSCRDGVPVSYSF